MKTKEVTFIKNHILFAHEVGETVTLQEKDAQRAIDLGVAVAGKKAAETADADPLTQKSIMEPVSDEAVKAATKQRAEAHGADKDSVLVGTEEGRTVLPVGTEPDGNKVLIRPEDNALAGEKKDDEKKA